MIRFIDTHAHLDFDYEDGKTPADIVKEAKEKNVTRIITISSSVESIQKSFEIAKDLDDVYHSMGVHPHDAKDFNGDVEQKILSLKNKKTVAIGEIGLDYYYEHSPKETQKKVFVKLIHLARTINLPIIVHVRDADKEAYEILKSEYDGSCSGVLHCYSGTKEQLKKYLDIGMHVSFTGIITFPKADSVREAAVYAPQNRIMLETDSPFLAPIPLRGKKNYPCNIPIIAQKLAEIRGQTLQDVAHYTTLNAEDLFLKNQK
jgi:TatD DNase family protein